MARRGPLSLRRVGPEDYDLLLTWWNDPEVRRLHGLPERPLARSAVESWYGGLPEGAQAWMVLEGGEPIGTIELLTVAPGVAELGVVIGVPERRGQGIGRRVVRRVARWAVAAGGFRAVQLSVREENLRARRAFAAAGFVEDPQVGSDGVRRMRFAPEAQRRGGRWTWRPRPRRWRRR